MIAFCYIPVDDEYWSNTNVTGSFGWPITNTAATDGMIRIGHWTVPARPTLDADPPPRLSLIAPTADPSAPGYSLRQLGYWRSDLGRRTT